MTVSGLNAKTSNIKMEFNIEESKNYKLIDGPLKVENIRVYHGSNYFSGGPVILFRLNLCEYDEVFTNQIDGFYNKLKKILPTLYEHYCSVGKPGGFFQRVRQGTLLGHVCEHISIELQTLAGMDVGYGKTRSTLKQGVYNVVFRYFDEVAGIYAGKAAVNLVNSILLNKDFNVFDIIENLIMIREVRMLGPSTQAIVDEAEKRKIPALRIDSYNLMQLGTGKFHKNIRATITSDTSMLAVETADNKFLSTLMLKDAGIPVLETIKTTEFCDVLEFYREIAKSIVTKPLEGYLGKNSMFDLNSEEEIKQGFELAKEFDDEIIVQPYLEGKSYRLLIIDYKFVAATELTPPSVVGNGKDTIMELIEQINSDPDRALGDKGKLTIIQIDETTGRILKSKAYTPETILDKGEILVLKKSGNPKLGGTSTDVTEKVNPFNRFIAERAAKVIGLNVAGVDIISHDIGKPLNENGGVVLEINAAPDFRMHINPAVGKPINVAKELLDMLFPAGSQTRIPIFSVTGSAGKTFAVNLLNYCMKKEGYATGMATSDGLFITDRCLKKGNMTYPEHIELVLKDPTIDCAIFETSCEGILRAGLGYQYADFGLFLNINEFHLGNDDIKYIEDLAYAKSVVVEQVYDEGYAILNADYDLILETIERIYSNIALFSKEANNQQLKTHVIKGGLAVYVQDDKIIIHNKNQKNELLLINDLPFDIDQENNYLLDSILAVITTLTAKGLEADKIKEYLLEIDCNV